MSFNRHYKPTTAWLELPKNLSDPVEAAPFPQHEIRYRNQNWSQRLGLSGLGSDGWVDHFGRFQPLPDNLPQPLALRYHGHQFTHYNPELGDGRGFLFAQLMDPLDQRLLDMGTKGSGQTPYSRQGDGRLTLKGAVREALATGYLEYLGVNTSKTFSIIETGEALIRYDEPSPTRSAVLVRLSHSHIRIGSFQRLAFLKDKKGMEALLHYCLKHFYPHCGEKDFFQKVCQKVAQTTAQWMIHGFVHGVLNTDNINITGESFDYGPYRFLPHYDPNFTAAYFDHHGLYSYGRQPRMVLWSLERLAESLDLIFRNKNLFLQGFETFQKEFEQQIFKLFCKKIGVLQNEELQKVQRLFESCIRFLKSSKAPYEAFFHHLHCWHRDPKTEDVPFLVETG